MNNNGHTKQAYLGDGVYASFDGFQIWLHLNRHDSEPLIALEPSTFDSLLRYAGQFSAYPVISTTGERL